MRHSMLVAVLLAGVSLSACSMFKDDAGSASATKADAKASASTPVAASAQEQKEMAAVMGESASPADASSALPPPPPEAAGDTTTTTTTTSTTDDGASADSADVASADTVKTENPGPAPANAPKECPSVEILPDTKSITYFDDPDGKPSGELIARASLSDIKGGCDYTADGVIVDIDMIMQGKITDKGRYEGRKDLEAFMTFPYFVAVMDPSGKMVDKKIMATAMRFKPEIDDLDHAEKITQTIPLADITQGPKYTITVGFQLNRAQLDYNRGKTSVAADVNKDAGEKKAPAKDAAKADKKPEIKGPAAKAGSKYDLGDAATGDDGSATPSVSDETPEDGSDTGSADTPSTPAPAQPAAKSSGAKMSPIVE